MLVGISAATTIVDVAVDGRAPVKALIREIQRDPLRPAQILHLDFYEIRADEKVTVPVPVHLVGIPDGVRNFGGVLDHSLRELEIEVLPGRHPGAASSSTSPRWRSATRSSCATSRSRRARSSTIPTPRSAPWSRRGPRRRPAVVAEEAAPAEPELIRKPKAEDEEDAEGEAKPKGESKQKG